ncbi:MAG: HD domain-containing protein [Deltaproteobacteria bacterium]|nr:HD domain-containing protein [Deltaproteobacteria bacterium]
MPEMSGVDFLSQAKAIAPDSLRILLTGHADMAAAMNAINKGEVYRFLTKPWNNDELKLTIQHAVDHAQLEKGFVGSVRVLAQVGEMHSSGIGSHAKRVAGLSKVIAEKMGLTPKEIFQIEMAALLHDIGKIGIPQAILDKREGSLSDTERQILERHVLQGETIVKMLPNLLEAAKIIRSHHERFDGNGYPDQKKKNNIPLGSRIIAITNAYDRALNMRNVFKNATPALALGYVIEQAEGAFDPQIAAVLREYVSSAAETCAHEIEIKPADLRENMVLSRDIKTAKGVLILSKDSRINNHNFGRVIKHIESNPFIEGIYVYRNA